MADELLLKIEGGVATLTMNRPDRRNAMNRAMLNGLAEQMEALDKNPDVRVVVIRGEGPAFCSGMDLREMRARQDDPKGDPESGVTQVLQRVERSRHPTIAMVHGDAVAGGCELALHCDLRVAAEGARFGMPLARIGLLVPFALGQKLVEILGPAHTRHLLFTGRLIDAKRAYEIGMVNQLVAPTDIERVTYELARQIAENAPLSLAGMKLAINRMIALREQIPHEDIDALARQAHRSEDAKEGAAAMLEKRKPAFKGR